MPTLLWVDLKSFLAGLRTYQIHQRQYFRKQRNAPLDAFKENDQLQISAEKLSFCKLTAKVNSLFVNVN